MDQVLTQASRASSGRLVQAESAGFGQGRDGELTAEIPVLPGYQGGCGGYDLVIVPTIDDGDELCIYQILRLKDDEHTAEVPWSPAPRVRTAVLRHIATVPRFTRSYQDS